jgi:N-acetylmuramoyl-L-alanine amidase
MEYKIEQPRLAFPRPLVRRKPNEVKYLVIHHTDGPKIQPVEAIHEYHKALGWNGVAYHFLVYESGRIVKARPTLAYPACVKGLNRICLCVAFVGSFMNRPPIKEHIDAGAWLCAYLKKKWREYYKVTLELKRHKDLADTYCPGEAFPWEQFLRRVEEWLRTMEKPILG